MMDLKNKKVTVVGLARSGVAACSLLREVGAEVSVTDCLDNQQVREHARNLDKGNISKIEIGRHTPGLIENQDLVVVSPGVPPGAQPISWAKERGIAVIGEVELAYAFCPAPIIAITGTNGKTTVTTLIGEIFRQAGRGCVVCGNIGNPFSGEVLRVTGKDVVALEVSSFQLETIDKFKPKVAAILNLGIDHLDRYANFEEYLSAKCRIFFNQDKEDWSILNADCAYKSRLLAKTKAQVLYFSKNKFRSKEFYFNENHNAAVTITSLFSIPEELALDTCRHFKGVEHRMEIVADIQDVQFINDSKATNVDSALWALNLINRPIILIAGGRDKGSDFTAARDAILRKVRAIILLGEAKEKIKQAFDGLVVTKPATSLKEAVESAFSLARAGDCVLLSPMCASFDMFTDYAERGKVFKEAVKSLT